MNVQPDIEEALIRSIRGTATEAELRRAGAWRAESMANEEYYRELKWLAGLADESLPRAATSPPSAAALIEAARARGASAQRPPAAATSRMRGAWAVAAAVVLLIGATVVVGSLADPTEVAQVERTEYRTAPGQQRTVELEDGTVVHLAPSTRLEVYGDPAAPQMWLEGRAFFGVPKKEDRRIVIETSAGRVTVLGTRFDLRSANGDLQLMVVDGRVSVTAGEEEAGVASGELGLVNSGDLQPVVRVQDPFEFLAWMESAMVFQTTPFSRAAEEIAARYDVAIDIQDAAVGARTITTSFEGSGLEDVLTVMCGVVQARCVLEGETVTVTSL